MHTQSFIIALVASTVGVLAMPLDSRAAPPAAAAAAATTPPTAAQPAPGGTLSGLGDIFGSLLGGGGGNPVKAVKDLADITVGAVGDTAYTATGGLVDPNAVVDAAGQVANGGVSALTNNGGPAGLLGAGRAGKSGSPTPP